MSTPVDASIRPARDDDAVRIAEIWRSGWHDAHDGKVPDALVVHRTPGSFAARAPGIVPHTQVAVLGDAVVGFVTVVDDEVDQLCVDAAARGTGLAGALLRAGERAVARAGHPEAWLAVVPGNARARRFYERQGWADGGPYEHRVTVEGDLVVTVPCRRYTRAVEAPRPSVLFVCVHNAGRSQMAAGFLRVLSGGAVDVRSAGSMPAERINPVAVEAMAEVGIDLRGEQPKVLTRESVQVSDVVVTMGCGDACPYVPGTRYEDWPLDDPAGQGIEAVRPIRDAIRARVVTLLGELGVEPVD